MSASPYFQCFKAVFFLHFYPPHVSKVSRKERKCYFLSAICSVNSLFCSTTTLFSALTEAPFTNQTDSTLRFSVDTTLPATVKLFSSAYVPCIIAYRRIMSVRKCDAVTNPFHHRTSSANQNISSSSRYASQSRPRVGRSGSTTG